MRKRCSIVFTAVAVACVCCRSTSAQPLVRSDALREPVMTRATPAIPQQNPRPLQGTSPEETWQIRRSDTDKPVGAFVESVQGNDAAIQLVVEQGRLLTLRESIAGVEGTAAVAVGDPTIVDFELLPNPKMIRLVGLRAGVTDLSITTATGEAYNFEVYVGWDLNLLQVQLRQSFPDATIELSQLREHLILEGQARSSEQVAQIISLVENYLASVQPKKEVEIAQAELPDEEPADLRDADNGDGRSGGEEGRRPKTKVEFAAAQIINLIRVPGVQQVMLQVRIGELNRTGLREIGGDLFFSDDRTGTSIGTQIGGNGFVSSEGFLEALALGANSTLFGVFPSADFEVVIKALRRNSVLNLLAEPNLVAMSGHEASFLAGGQFPVPVPQTGGGNNNNVTIQFKNFGVQLNFTPYVLDDETIRLQVAPEVSSIDFGLGTTLVAGGEPVPGINTRKTSTTVELQQGQTLALAGLMQVDLDADTARIPGLGDLPYIGALFSNTTHERVEKELVVLVTPFLVAPIEEQDVAPLPGSEIQDPNDLEFFLLRRIEGRTGIDFRAPTSWDNPLGLVEHLNLEQRYIQGAVGHSH